MKLNLKNYVCTTPFTNIEIKNGRSLLCCEGWLRKKLPDAPIDELWNSEEAIDIRKSVMDGSYRYCEKYQCPFLAQLHKFEGKGDTKFIMHKDKLPEYIKRKVDAQDGYMEEGPKMVQFSFDQTCNLKCPSCRFDIITADSNGIKKADLTIEQIEKHWAKDLIELYITGSGDPFVSVSFRNFLRKFDHTKYPKLKNIHLHTNATRWSKEMWESMPNVHKYIKTCEISIDAGTQFTYENYTRLGGKWDDLITNLKFIETLPNLKSIKTSFVVQDTNYFEMKIFLDLMKSIFGKKVTVYFGKINNWSTYSDAEFKIKQVWDIHHPEFEFFRKELHRVCFDSQVFHNMHEFIDLSKKTLL